MLNPCWRVLAAAGFIAVCLSHVLLSQSAARQRSSGPAISDKTTLTRIGFGSCLHQDKPQQIWRAVLRQRPQLFLMLGDNVYGDVSSGDMTELKRAYETQAENPEFAAARNAIPFWAIWDDHDYGRNDAGAAFAHKQKAAELFRQFWGETGPRGTADSPGLYASRTFGPEERRLQIILLDTRWFRAPFVKSDEERAQHVGPYLPDTDPAKTMLGEAQWQWLERELRRPAKIRLIVSSVQVLADGHRWERWGQLPHERRRLLDLITATEAKGVILLSGDRHFGAVYVDRSALGYPLFEITSSSLNLPFPRDTEIGKRRISPIIDAANFGRIDIDWEKQVVNLTLRGTKGALLVGTQMTFADLGTK